MARNTWSVTTGAVVATGAATLTMIQIINAANLIQAIKKISVTFDGASPTAVPVRVRVLRQTTAGTPGATPTVVKKTDRATNLQVTAASAHSAEPTAGAVLHQFYLHPQSGEKNYLPFGDEIEIPTGGRLGVECLAPVTVNCMVEVDGEE